MRSGDSPLVYPGETYTNEVDQSKGIRTQPRPLMVVASSGMLTGGRIMHHLKDFLPDPACTLLFIGYQGEGTLGRHIQSGGKAARIDGRGVPDPLPRPSSSPASRRMPTSTSSTPGSALRLKAGGTSRGDGKPKRVFWSTATPTRPRPSPNAAPRAGPGRPRAELPGGRHPRLSAAEREPGWLARSRVVST